MCEHEIRSGSTLSGHSLEAHSVLGHLDSRAEGLGEEDANRRRTKYGDNRIPPPKRRSPLVRLLAQFNNVLIYVLLGAAVVTALLEHLVDSGVIICVVIINGLIGFIQEGKAEKAIDAVRNMLSAQATVIRAGHRYQIPAESLVPGDVVFIQSGDRVPADLRLFRLKELRIEEAVLTGESVPGEKTVEPTREDALAKALPRDDLIPFESQHRFMATLHHDHLGNGYIYVKGAYEAILQRCLWQRCAAADEPLDSDRWLAYQEQVAALGQRTLALAVKPAEPGQRTLRFEDVETGLVLLGLVGIIDPPREEAIAAVAQCRSAGIQVKMITGDHAGTAAAIAVQMGLAEHRRALTGVELEQMSEEALRAAVEDVDVFARASPEHKLRLVQALQARGRVVAMTGDGVNDAPALKRADVGIAMGIKGTEAAKESAEMVLAVRMGMLKQSQNRTKRAALREESISRQPASTAGWLATMPTGAPFMRPKPVTTASPGTRVCSIPKSTHRCSTNVYHS